MKNVIKYSFNIYFCSTFYHAIPINKLLVMTTINTIDPPIPILANKLCLFRIPTIRAENRNKNDNVPAPMLLVL